MIYSVEIFVPRYGTWDSMFLCSQPWQAQAHVDRWTSCGRQCRIKEIKG